MGGRRRILTILVALVATLGGVAAQSSVAAAADIGYEQFTYAPLTGPATGTKPESKLWFADGSWWASMFRGADAPHLPPGSLVPDLERHGHRARRSPRHARRHPVGRREQQALCRLPCLERRQDRRVLHHRRARCEALALQLRRRRLHARSRLPGEHQQRRERDADDRPRLHRHAVGHLGAGQPGLRQPRDGRRCELGRTVRAPRVDDEPRQRRHLLARALRRRPRRPHVQQRDRPQDVLRRAPGRRAGHGMGDRDRADRLEQRRPHQPQGRQRRARVRGDQDERHLRAASR